MKRVFQFTAGLLLALWFPATEHCALADLGLLPQWCADNCETGQADSQDACGTIESGAYRSANGSLKVSAPSIMAGAAILFLLQPATKVMPESAILPAESYRRPQTWTGTWHFVRRAAPAPRAPSVCVA